MKSYFCILKNSDYSFILNSSYFTIEFFKELSSIIFLADFDRFWATCSLFLKSLFFTFIYNFYNMLLLWLLIWSTSNKLLLFFWSKSSLLTNVYYFEFSFPGSSSLLSISVSWFLMFFYFCKLFLKLNSSWLVLFFIESYWSFPYTLLMIWF